ncbi:hypothetical protein CC78DRAFT_566452 [Lojkania enalia]|uniref:C2H2-type domain-containing protein n=1 Tax=Lojkania enalia TaxID=147567 RepID=A0A9P4KE64_9PLEO|nr:hypothetical protein CC78DRAFT_566452 [Didymosphaeria enalia]
MPSNNYSAYYYQSGQRSSTPQYSGYSIAPASSSIPQASRTYQQLQSFRTSQPQSYMSYPAQSYGGRQGSVYGEQEVGWGASNYGSSREVTSNRAAELLHNMSNTAYDANPIPVTSHPSFLASNTPASARYSSGAANSQQPQQQAHSPYAQTQAQPRPRSVNTNRNQATDSNRGLPSPGTAAAYPSQRVQTLYNQQPQQTPSPAQNQYSQNTPTPLNSFRTAAMATTQYNDYSNRQLPSVDASQGVPSSVSASYSYSDPQAAVPIAQTAVANNVSEQYNQATITVDPIAVYDPWPEYQRKQIERARKAAEDAAKAEEEHRAEERRKEEEMMKHEEEQPRATQVQMSKSHTGKAKPHDQSSNTNATDARPAGGAQGLSGESSGTLEAEIRAIMAKMRELNNKDPALLARIWEEERRAKAPKSPIVQNKATPQPAPAQPALPAQASSAPAANQRKKAVPKETTTPKAVAQPTPVEQVASAPPRPAGNTIWPPEKKSQLANAAATYLHAQNPSKLLTPEHILGMLDGNPSYIELCEQLEGMGLKLDRAAFAKNLLTVVPDVNSASRPTQAQTQTMSKSAPQGAVSQVNHSTSQRVLVQPPAIATKAEVSSPAAPSPRYAPAVQSPMSQSSYPPLPNNSGSASHSPAPMAEMVPIKPKLKRPANKEEAARKRTFNDLIDLTALSDEDVQPAHKRQSVVSPHHYQTPSLYGVDNIDIDHLPPPVANFRAPISVPIQTGFSTTPAPLSVPTDARFVVEPIDKGKALRRNTYNIKTIARDVLLACGRHPEERALNAHLEILKINIPQVDSNSDLSTIRWDIIDPGKPPRGYFKEIEAVSGDADDEDDSEVDRAARSRQIARAVGARAGDARVQALTPTNPFKPMKRRGRPPRHSYPINPNDSIYEPFMHKAPGSTGTNMSASAPRPNTAAVGYSVFRAATPQLGPDGKPLPKKKGRPVGWRKAIHGSAAAQARPSANGHTGLNRFVPSQPSTLRNVNTGSDEPIVLNSRSSSVSSKVPRYQSFKCKWYNCKAELHNLETLKKHVHKVHRKATLRGTLECLWGVCGREIASIDPVTNLQIERHQPFVFKEESQWREHLEIRHFSPLSWQLGDGPASGLSDAHDSEAYLSDAQGRRVTPRVTVDPSRYSLSSPVVRGESSNANPSSRRGRGRPPKVTQEQEAREAQAQMISQKKRIGGPGMDRGGATLVNEKRRKGFIDHADIEEEFVDAEQ